MQRTTVLDNMKCPNICSYVDLPVYWSLIRTIVTGITAYKRRPPMNRIIKIGIDAHSKNYTLCAMEPTIGAEEQIFGEIQVAPDYKEVICFI